MTFKETEKELARLEGALLKAATLKEWDTLVHKYNALKLDYCRMTGENISYLSVSMTDRQLLNIKN